MFRKVVIGNCTLLKGNCEEVMEELESNSINAVVSDPPYLYLKHKLDIPFNEDKVFGEWKRLLKNNSMISFFGRGDHFFRWNLMLDKLGFKFKETAVWEKENASNYLNNFLRIHEDISFRSFGNANLRKLHVDYLEYQINKNKLDRIIDIWKGLRSALNSKDKDDVIRYIETGVKEFNYESKRKYEITARKHQSAKRVVNLFQSVKVGRTETSIMRCNREQYQYQHPTQKPVALMERIVKLVSDENDTILDPFMGVGSTGVACINTNRKFIGIELDDEYFDTAVKRVSKAYQDKQEDIINEKNSIMKIIISTNFKRIWKAGQISKSSFIIKIDTIKNLVCVKNILDFKQNQFLKISKIKANKKFFYSFFNINLSISFNYPSVKKITNQYRRYAFGGIRNLFKSFENKSKKYLCGAVL
ncbi:DNA-methyltransferase [Brachyspira hyodysenteriae]|uniref:DNA-methyltransferase n=1 Tax=Brachyspira hyodysenteriae TaxID=159 RepID=UPI0022CE0728|nr:site-specific DNA-methyltransferase [Brachyspira hyodysenteriae]MCZ9988249.1 site-specific DNA-methyltransferase [Brachyspira hyodysenteriae]